jgi:hypothetical protein
MTLDEIKAAISTLTLEERAELAQCLHGWEDDEWDRQMRQDVKSGKFDKIVREVDTQTTSNVLRELP